MLVDYMEFEADYAGSRSKNRFKFEVYWGLSKFLEIIKHNKNFTMIFDYVCDIEIHHKDCYEFYQVKTTNATFYNPKNLTKMGTKKNSVIGTLYKIRSKEVSAGKDLSKIAIVSNVSLKDPTIKTIIDEIAIKDIGKTNKADIISTLNKEFDQEDINIDNIFFIKTDLSLDSYKETMIGRINTFYHEIHGNDAFQPAVLLNVLSEEIQLKADYEKNLDNYEEILEKKGLSTARFEVIIDKYSERMFSITQKCKDEINHSIKNFKKKLDYLKELPILVSDVRSSTFTKGLLEVVKKDILVRMDEFEDGELIEIAIDYIKMSTLDFPIEFTISIKELLALIALIELEEQNE